MAAPQLKKTAVAAPTRKLINSGVVPTKQVRLKGMNGQVIQPKAPTPLLKKKSEGKIDAEEEKKPLAEGAPAAEEAAPTGPTEEELAAQAAYEKEMEEYNRQMEEYNKQVEEYERMMAEEARKKAEEEEAKKKA